jgi:ATP-dependent RNA helicase DDX5/DBP2
MQVWPAAMRGHDLIGIAETGSGKTLAYMLPMMIHIVSQPELVAGEGPIGVVLSPTRELAHQIEGVAKLFSSRSGLKSLCISGGSPMKEQEAALQEMNDIIVATPGRFIHFLNDGWTNLNRVSYIVIDEADEMLRNGFSPQIDLIMSQVRPDRQILMFSATWPKEVQALAKKHCKENDPLFIRVGGDKLAACRTLQQMVLVVQNENKFVKLYEAVEKTGCHVRNSVAKCLVFCKSKKGVDELAERLMASNIDVATMHGEKSQGDRTRASTDFKSGCCSLMICTNILGRGHDIPRVKLIMTCPR